MLRLRHSSKRACTNSRTSGVILAVLALLAAMTWTVWAQETVQRTFASPQEAMRALVEALRAGDKDSLRAILGPESEEILSSGDPVSDQADRDRFLQAYDEKVDLAKEKTIGSKLFWATIIGPSPSRLCDRETVGSLTPRRARRRS